MVLALDVDIEVSRVDPGAHNEQAIQILFYVQTWTSDSGVSVTVS